MKVLFVYRYLTLGGCESVIRARLESLPGLGIAASAWFLEDGQGRRMFADLAEGWTVGAVDELAAAIASEGYDAVSCLDTPEAFPAFGPGASSPRLIIEVHSPYPETRRYLDDLGSMAISAFFVPSEYQARIVRYRTGEGAPIRVVPNPLRQIFVTPPGPVFRPVRPVVGWVGRLDRQKNWSDFIEVARLVARSRPDTEFWLIGGAWRADETEGLRRSATSAGVIDRLRWFGGVDHARIPTFLDMIRESGGVVISTSGAESFGMTIAEAMARGCAVIAPSFGPFPEFVEAGHTGELYALGDCRRASELVLSFLGDDDRRSRSGGAAREEILARFAPEVASIALAGELRRLVG